MKEIKTCGAQGDVLFRRVEKLPPGAQAVKPEAGQLVVAHSETGHHHAVDASKPGIELFMDPKNPLVGWLKIPAKAEGADVVHHRPFDTHETMRLLADEAVGETIFEIRRQRERSPEGWRRVED